MASSSQAPSVLILGATSAVAAEVAVLFAQRGSRLHLVGRNPEKLSAVAVRCLGGMVTTQSADFEDFEHNAEVITSALRELGCVDIALIAHGDLGDQLLSESSFEEAERIVRVNFTSAVSLLVPLANHMQVARSGRIAVITSVAGDRGRPHNFTYGAAKGALSIYLQGLRSKLYPAGVGVTTLKLGPVDSPMTTTHAKNALFSTPSRVARCIVQAIDAGVAEVYVPSFWRFIMSVVRSTPEPLFQRLTFLSGR